MDGHSTSDVTSAQTRCLELLGPAQEILDRFNHRNKNQHRLSKWWKQFDMLRRGIRKLIAELEDYLEGEARAIAKRKKSKKNNSDQKDPLDTERVRLDVRAGYVLEQLVPRAFLAFTQLAADNQYAHLGLALLGVLAQVHDAVAPLVMTPELLSGTDKPNTVTIAEPVPSADVMEATVDFGVAVSRSEITTGFPRAVEKASQAEGDSVKRKSNNSSGGKQNAGTLEAMKNTDKPQKKKKRHDDLDDIFHPFETEESTKKKKKRSKKRDEFDDIFGSLT